MTYRSMAKHLAFIGSGDWNYYTTNAGGNLSLVAISKDGNENRDSCFGDRLHILSLIRGELFDGKPTDKGLEFISGLRSNLIKTTGGIKHYLTY